MKSALRLIGWLVILPIGMALALYLQPGGSMEHHFHKSLADRTFQNSIHTKVIHSGFRLRQRIDTRELNTEGSDIQNAPVCVWLRLEYPRLRNWGMNGTLLFRLSTDEQSWQTSKRTESITTFFQPICFPGSSVKAVADRPTYIEVSVAEAGLRDLGFFAMAPANGMNNSVIDGQISNHTLTYRISINRGMQPHDALLIGAMFLFACTLIAVLWLSTLRRRASGSAGSNL